ncbi:MAG: hypothetical protein IPQ19_07275 [Bacteroidetes bacterium]|nr:hypothetical protein [Bacteroidota bacterium]
MLLEKFQEIMDFGMELYFKTLSNKEDHMTIDYAKIEKLGNGQNYGFRSNYFADGTN